MGEAGKRPLRLQFDWQLKLEFHGTRVTSGTRGPRAVLNLEEDGLTPSGRRAVGRA